MLSPKRRAQHEADRLAHMKGSVSIQDIMGNASSVRPQASDLLAESATAKPAALPNGDAPSECLKHSSFPCAI